MTFLQKINPINTETEKQKFFFDQNYNPQFKYEEKIDEKELSAYYTYSDRYVGIAEKILSKVNKLYGSSESFLLKTFEPILTADEALDTINQYLLKEKVDDLIEVKQSTNVIARSAIVKNTLFLKKPLRFSESGLVGMLNHEIGTHFFRTLNDQMQMWHKNRQEYKLHPYITTEEGLATLHAHLHKKKRFTASSGYILSFCCNGSILFVCSAESTVKDLCTYVKVSLGVLFAG